MAVARRMDRLPLSWIHWKVVIVVGLGSVFRSMNIGIVAFVLASLATDWNLSSAEIGALGSLGVAGMVVGVAVIGVASDRLGRKSMFEVTFAVFMGAAALCAIAWNVASLLVFRFVSGLGQGGGSPPALTLVTELSPSGHRGLMMLVLEVFWVMGTTLAAVVAYLVIPSLGWRMAFLAGAVPLLYILIIHRMLPESPRFLLERGMMHEAEDTIRRIERECKVEPGLPLTELTDGGARRFPRARLSELFAGPYLKRTVCVWILWSAICYSNYGVFLWLPTLIASTGLGIARTYELMIVISAVQIPGCILAALVVDRIGRKGSLVPCMLLGGVAAYMFGLSRDAESILLWGSLYSFSTLAGWGIMTAFTAELYPTRLRSTGVGWAGAFGRIAGIIAPMLTGFLVDRSGGDYGPVFLIFAAVLLLGGLNVVLLGEETAGKSLERLSA